MSSATTLFVLDRQERVIGVIKNGGGVDSQTPAFFDDVLTEDLQTGAETFTFSTIDMGDMGKNLVIGNFIAFKKNGKYKLFQIMQVEQSHEEVIYIQVYCESAGLELLNKVFRARKLPSADLRHFLTTVLDDTGWNVGMVDGTNQNALSFDLEDSTVYATLQNNISQFGVELEFRVEINGGRISQKFIDTYAARGKVTGKRFVFGKDIEKLTRKIDATSLYTALIGRGRDGLKFSDITLSGIDKPAGQDFVTDQEAFDRYNNNGYHIMGIFDFDTNSPEELLRETYKQLQKCKEPKIEYEIDVAMLGELLGEPWNKISIGDTVAVIDTSFNPAITLMARVSKLETSFTNPQGNKCTLANFIEVGSNISDEMRKIASELQGYVDQSVSNKFPIGGEDIKDNAVGGNHIYQNSITTDHLQADSINADKIQAGSITATEISSKTITALEIASKTITAEEIKAGTITGTEIKADTITGNHIQSGTINGDKITAGTITALEIQAGAIVGDLIQGETITGVHIKGQTITGDKIQAGSITGTEIKAETITGTHIKAGTITGDKIVGNSITGNHIQGGTITGDKITGNSISGSHIKGDTITGDKITAGTITGHNIKAGSISATEIKAESITGNLIAANTIVGGHLQANSITGDKIKAGSITADRIQAGSITAESGVLGTACIKTAHIGDAQITSTKIQSGAIGSAQITDGAIISAKIGKAQIEGAHIKNATIDDAKIQNIKADKITAGTLDCGNITVRNLRADSITAGSLTVEGNNLIHNSAFKKNDGSWDGLGPWVIDTNDKFENENSVKISRTSATDGTWAELKSEPITVTEGQTFVGSAYFKTSGLDSGSNYVIFALWGYRKDGSRVGVREIVVSENISSYRRIIIAGAIPSGVETLRLCFSARRNGTINVAKPMLSRGSVASIWKEHNDELISDGAIDNDKLGDNAITSNKLNLDELFVSQSAFVNHLQAVELSADQITTGKISGEIIDLVGLINFEALDPTLQDNFVFDTTSNKTFINGGHIYTNSITADKINARGLTITNTSNETTFKVDDDGEVYVTGNIQSTNFDEVAQTGYKLTKDGDMILNNATVRGDVILPNAGVTNFGGSSGGKNILINTSYEKYSDNYRPGWDTSKNGTLSPDRWSSYNAGVSNPNTGYHAHLDIEKFGYPVMKYVCETTSRWLGSSQGIDAGKIKPNTEYTFSLDVYGESAGVMAHGGLYYHRTTDSVIGFHAGQYNFTVEEAGKWKRYVWRFRTTKELDTSRGCSWYIYGYNAVGTMYCKNAKLSEGKDSSNWSPATEDKLNPVRFWAGVGYANRNNAPFRVHQDGSMYATKGNFEGTFSGSIDVGNIHISDTNTSKAVFKINTNNDAETRVFLSEEDSYFNTNLVFGTMDRKQVEFDVNNRRVNITDSALKVTRSGNNGWVEIGRNDGVYSPLSIGFDKGQFGDYRHNFAFAGGGLVFDNVGARGSDRADYWFRKKGGAERVKVEVEGTLDVEDDIVLGVMKIAKRTDAGNEGVDFII